MPENELSFPKPRFIGKDESHEQNSWIVSVDGGCSEHGFGCATAAGSSGDRSGISGKRSGPAFGSRIGNSRAQKVALRKGGRRRGFLWRHKASSVTALLPAFGLRMVFSECWERAHRVFSAPPRSRSRLDSSPMSRRCRFRSPA